MPSPYGLLGGLSYAVEATYGADPGSGHTFVHHISSTLGKKRPVIYPDRLSVATSTTKPYGVPFVDGDTVQQLCFTEAIIGKLFGACGLRSGAGPYLYVIGGAGVPVQNRSLVIRENYGIHTLPSTYYELVHTGCKPGSLKIDIVAHKA